MCVLIGYAVARFQKDALLERDFAKFLRPLGLVLLPYYLILAGYSLAWGSVPWASILLVGNFGIADPGRHTMLAFLYWFVEAYVQMLAVLAGLLLHPTMIHQWKKALLDGAADIFERGTKKTAEVDEDTVRSRHAKIGELAVANDFLSRKLKPWGEK